MSNLSIKSSIIAHVLRSKGYVVNTDEVLKVLGLNALDSRSSVSHMLSDKFGICIDVIKDALKFSIHTFCRKGSYPYQFIGKSLTTTPDKQSYVSINGKVIVVEMGFCEVI